MKLGGVILLLQALAVAAERVHAAADASATFNLTHKTNELGNVNANSALANLTSLSGDAPLEGANSTHRNAWLSENGTDWRHGGNHNRTGHTLAGGRREGDLPKLEEFKQSVALLLQMAEDETEQLQGCITIPIAPRFFITRASCVRNAAEANVLFVEATGTSKKGPSNHHQLKIKATTEHPDYQVNLAIIEVEASKNKAAMLTPLFLGDVLPAYYDREDHLGLISIDNIFNPSLAKNPRSIKNLVRVSPSSCRFGSTDDIAKCYVPADLKNRQLAFEFGQGMLMYDNYLLVGLPDCEGLCSGGMFYSATHLATYRTWIDETTLGGSKWMVVNKSKQNKTAVPVEKEPSYVSLFTSSAPGAKPVCGGSLIAPRYVLTTASCVANHTLTTARIGHGDRTTIKSTQEDVIPTLTVSVHPQFGNSTRLSNDLAVIELAGPTLYTPTILASNDQLDGESVHAVGTGQPRRSTFDASIMCLPPRSSSATSEGRMLQSMEDMTEPSADDFLNFSTDDFVLDTETPPKAEQPELLNVEQWNKAIGDGVLEVPKETSYYLLGVSLGLQDSTIKTGNHSEARLCSLNETVGDDDDSALVVRLATPETVDFINTVSVDHTWNDPHALPKRFERMSIFDTSFRVAPASINASYDGLLDFVTPPSNLDLGFVVGLRLEKEGQNYCGGSLIAPSYVLTAAHCVGGDRAKFVSVGSRESAGAEAEVIAVKSTNVITHPLYGKRSLYSYDIAVLELESQAYPKPITLDNSRELNPSLYMTLYGYGADSASSTKLSDKLRSVDLPYFPRDKCESLFPELDKSMFCAGGELARDACTGDSGSPLVRVVQGKPLLVGVVSSGRNGCGTPGVPGVYAFVAEMQDFIDSVVAGNKWVSGAPYTMKTTAAGTTSPVSTNATSAEEENRASSAEAEAPVLRSSGLNMTDLPFEIIKMANGSMEHQLMVVEMAKDTPSRLQIAVMEFLVGDYEYVSGWTPKTDQQWTMSFFSTGDLSRLMEIIKQHKAKPLYARKSRFIRPATTSQRASDNRALLSHASCSDAH